MLRDTGVFFSALVSCQRAPGLCVSLSPFLCAVRLSAELSEAFLDLCVLRYVQHCTFFYLDLRLRVCVHLCVYSGSAAFRTTSADIIDCYRFYKKQTCGYAAIRLLFFFQAQLLVPHRSIPEPKYTLSIWL